MRSITKNTLEIINRKTQYMFIKRVLDIILAIIGIIVTFPLAIIISIVIKLDSKGPAIFIHNRIGKNGKELKLWKFRTMVDNAEELINNFTIEQREEFYKNFKLKDDHRLTKIGRLLRNANLDELPQLVNILKGDLSFVGPRPIVKEELEKYQTQKQTFLACKPGLTGYWVIKRTDNTTYEERIKMEIYYIKNISFKLDAKIFFATIIKEITGKNILS